MQKKKTLSRVILLFTAVLLLLSIALMTSCGRKKEILQREGPYDIVIKVKSTLGDEWFFDLDTKEMYVEYEYTGNEIDFEMTSYNLPYDYWLKDYWYDYINYGDEFKTDCLYYDIDGVQAEGHQYRSAKERGLYVYCFICDGVRLKYRQCLLKVTIV